MNGVSGHSNTALPHIVYAVTSPMTADFLLRGQLNYMREQGFRVTLIASPSDELNQVAIREGVEVIALRMKRLPSPFDDLSATIRLIGLLRKLRPDIINYSTPKAALLASIASWIVRIPHRVYVLRGLRVEGMAGLKRKVFLYVESIPAWCATSVICNSISLRKEATRLGVISEAKSKVLGNGSSNGVDCSQFRINEAISEEANTLREQLGIATHDVVIGFMGRMVRDKGVVELLQAFDQLTNRYPHVHLVMVGPREVGDDLGEEVWKKMEVQRRVTWLGQRNETRPIYAMFDLLVLPTYREGLPNVALEAAAMGLPVVTTRVTGAKDAVIDGQTGTLVESRNAEELAQAIEKYLVCEDLRETHGEAGKSWVRDRFRSEVVWKRLADEYRSMIGQREDQ